LKFVKLSEEAANKKEKIPEKTSRKESDSEIKDNSKNVITNIDN